MHWIAALPAVVILSVFIALTRPSHEQLAREPIHPSNELAAGPLIIGKNKGRRFEVWAGRWKLEGVD